MVPIDNLAAADAFFAFTFSTFVDYACIMNGYEHLSVEALVVIGIGTMAIWSICNLLRVDQQGKIHTFAASLQIIFTVAVLVSLWSTCQQGQQASASDVFFKTYNGTGFASFPYVVLIGILSSLYSFTGYEAAAHMAEETQDASMAVPKGIVYTCIATAITGGLYILSLLFASAYHVEEFASSEIGATYIFQKCMGDRGANIMNYFILVNLFFSGMSSLTVTIRTAFAVARDGGFPFSTYVQQVNPRSKVPEYAVFAVFLMGSSLLLLQLISSTAFVAVTSTSTIGFQISYAIPIILRVTVFREKFQKADFHLGRWGVVCGRIAAIFLVTTSILFTFPVQYPITFENFNYTIVILAACATLGTIHWTFSGRYWFLGPGREHIVD